MKKYLIKQTKKSISLFLAVLMVLSCWVWVAPQKAEAANTAGEGYYQVQVLAKITDNAKNGMDNNSWSVAYKEKNGQGTAHTEATGTRQNLTTNSTYSEMKSTTSGDIVMASGWVNGWPTEVYCSLSSTSSWGTRDGWRLENVRLQVYNNTTGKWVDMHTAQNFSGNYHGITNNYGDISTYFTVTAKAPYFAKADAMTATSVHCPGITSTDTNTTKTAAAVPTYWDQYGVKWLNSVAPEYHISKSEDGEDIGSGEAKGFWTSKDGVKGYVNINANMQVEFPPTDGSVDYYMVAVAKNTENSDVKASQKITVTFDKYTLKVDGAGSISGLNYTLGLSDSTTTDKEWKQEGYYGAAVDVKPDGTASAKDANGNDTYTFKGLWSKEQPSTGKASYNELEADFAEPISKDKFDEYEANGGTVNGDYITYNNVLYFNAGKAWDPKIKTVTGSETYYGWWLSKDITVKFYDIDGKYLGTKTVKYGQTHADIDWADYAPTDYYVSGAYTYDKFNGTWVDINGDTVSQSGCTFTRDLILTPKYDKVDFDKTYTVNFINQADGTNLTGSAAYNYRTDISSKVPADQGVPVGVENDLQYSYTFEGWSAQTPSSKKYYHILLEDGNFNEAGTAIAYKTAESDWIVRSDVTYYPVYRRHLRTYAVNFVFKDSTGTEISRKVTLKYGETLSAPTDYVPYTYAKEGFGYKFKNWKYTDASGDQNATFGYSNSIVFTEENIRFGLGNVEDGTENVKPVNISADYYEGVPTPYTVTFKYKNDKGEDQTTTAEVKHGSLITGDTVNALVPADEYDDGEAMVHYTGEWKLVTGAGKLNDVVITEGAEGANDPEISKTDFVKFSPTSHVTFEAVYGDPQPFYMVTYFDGANTFSERVLQGSNLPAWTYKSTDDNGTPDDTSDDVEDDIEYLPKMEATAQGSYEFQGWFDEKQADTTYGETNGNKYDEQSIVTSNLTLYPQFKFTPFTYTIKFMSYDGKVQLAAGKYKYGQNIEMLIAEANRAAQVREQDDTYTYSFIGWDKTVPTFCEGKDMTFIAQYKPIYRYYNVKWYNSVLDGENWVADKTTKIEDGKTVETGLLTTTKHTYNSKLNAPSVKAVCSVDAPNGQSYVFTGWYYNDAGGNAQPYVRGMAITGEMEFYATYKLTDKLYIVTTDVKDETEEYKVAANDKATAIPTPNAGYVDATKHDEFKGWYTTSTFAEGTEFDLANTAITEDITIYAKFTESEHDYDNEELVTAPTYYAKGEKKTWCSCDAKLTEKTDEIDMLTDGVKPTGTIYLGTQGSWSSTGTPAYETDNQPVSLFANADTDLIITANDTGDIDALYNASGIGKGIANIKAFVFPGETALTATNYGAATEIATTVFEDKTEELNNTANYVIKLGDLYVADLAEDGEPQLDDSGNVKYKKLEDGETYIVYYYVTDKAGNRLDRLVRTAKFIYDNKAPVFTVEGYNNADKVTGTPTYCETATVAGVEVGATLTVNGEAVALTTTSAAGTGSYTITEAGNYLVTVTDKAGNKTSKKFQLNADHSYDVKEVHSSCFADGYKTEVCIICGDEKDKVVYPTTGHDWESSPVPATCTENGYTYKVCPICGTEEKIYEVDGKLIDPAHDHIYDMADGEIVYTVVTAATCKTKGKEIATCKACGETITREIAIDEDAHSWGAVKTLKATCTEAGKTYHTCKLCYTSEDLTTISATGHVETQWVETKAATCGEAGVETLQCKKCKVYVDSDDADTVADTREIPATGRHILAVSDDPTKTYEATADKEGQITRYCTQCGQEWVEKVDKIEKYTVKFVDEDGTTELKTITDVVKGTTIEKTAVTEPTKANSTDGKYKYTFAGWKDASGNAVTLPIDITADITLKASYTQSTIIYTHQFMVPNTWVSPLSDDGYEEFATMMGAMGDSRVPVAEPTFSLADKEADAALKKLYTFKFLGWSTTGAKGDIVTDFTIAGDATFFAVFEAKAIAYQVIYYNGTEYVWDTTVNGGDTVEFGGTEPTKAPDADNHYTFDKWYTDATLKTEYKGEAITALTRLYAGFTSATHTWEKDTESDKNKDATCTSAAEVAYKCTACEATKVEVEGEKLGHTPEEDAKTEIVDDVTYSVVYCSVCGAEISRTKTSVTIVFKNWNGIRLDTLNLDIGADITQPTATRAADNQNTYNFKGWFVEGDTTETVVEITTATADAVYVAKFEATARKFLVTYADANNKEIYSVKLSYGDKIPAFNEADYDEPTKAYDDFNHYTFAGWSVEAGTEVTADTTIQPVYTAEKHTCKETGVLIDATCTTKGGKEFGCTACDYTYNKEGLTPALGHNFVETKRVEPNYATETDGYVDYECSRCGETKHEVLSIEYITVSVTVKDTNGAARKGVSVVLYKENSNEQVGTATTNDKGVATFRVVPGKYQAIVAGSGEKTDVTVSGDGSVSGGEIKVEPEVQAPKCSCSCHKTSFWGILFRLFHKFIKLFTGKYICCNDPSDMY